jgi:hypothetical protein
MSGICKKCCRCGYEDEQIGKRCKSCKDGIIERDPPFSELVDPLDGSMTCGRRYDTWAGIEGKFLVHGTVQEGLDHWNKFKSNGDRVCSYCGSLHWDDFTALVKQSSEASEDVDYKSVVEIEPSDKGYKIYVHQRGVRNASEGGIKFYTQHIPRDENGEFIITKEQNEEFARAVKASKKRFNKYLVKMRGI